MGHVGGFIVVFLLLGLALAEATTKTPYSMKKPIKPKHANKCSDKKSPCFHLKPYCPIHCPTSCQVDCKTCKLVCLPASPPPPKPTKPKSPPPKKPYPPPAPTHPHLPSPTPPITTPTHPYPPSPTPPITTPTHPYPPSTTPPITTPAPGGDKVSPPAGSTGPKKVRCMNKKYPLCYYKEHTCPAACPGSCEVDCVTCSPVCNCDKPGAVCQDPRFIGADGITFYFHGKKDHDFCLVADSNLHINGHFIGKRNDEMKRDFTWVQSLGIMFDHHKVYIGAQKTATWNDAVDRLALSFDDEPIFLPDERGATWNSSNGALTITRTQSANGVEIEAKGKLKIKAIVVPITNKESLLHNYGINEEEDSFAHLDLSFKFYSLSGDVNGVLGQTYASNYVSRVKMGVSMPVLGGDDLFSSSSLFSTDCEVARFSGNSTASEKSYESADLNCATSLTEGQGVVCKR